MKEALIEFLSLPNGGKGLILASVLFGLMMNQLVYEVNPSDPFLRRLWGTVLGALAYAFGATVFGLVMTLVCIALDIPLFPSVPTP